jgi:sortase B
MKLRKLLIVILLGVFIYSSYEVISYLYDTYKSKVTYDEIRRQFEEQLEQEEDDFIAVPPLDPTETMPAEPTEPVVMSRYKPLLEINQDVVGWVSVPDTVINYPVVQAEDNDYYLRRDIHGERATAGTIFMDYRSDARANGRNTILYGHHMRNGTMFKDLVKYKNEEFFQNNPIVRFDTLYEEIEWEVFSAYVTHAGFPYIQTVFASDEEYLEFLSKIKSQSIFHKDMELTSEDRILTLSTCTYEYDDARFVVHARRITR